MSRAIKVEDQVYQALDMIREKGETFSREERASSNEKPTKSERASYDE